MFVEVCDYFFVFFSSFFFQLLLLLLLLLEFLLVLLHVAKFEIVGVVEVVKVCSGLFVSFHLALLYHHFTS